MDVYKRLERSKASSPTLLSKEFSSLHSTLELDDSKVFTKAQQTKLGLLSYRNQDFVESTLNYSLPAYGDKVIKTFLNSLIKEDCRSQETQSEFISLITVLSDTASTDLLESDTAGDTTSAIEDLEQYFKEQREVIEVWLDNQTPSIKIQYVTDSRNNKECYDHDQNLIVINRRNKYETQVYTLLHECGHYLLRNDEETYNKRFPYDKFNDDVFIDSRDINKAMRLLRKQRLNGKRSVSRKTFKGLRSASYTHVIIKEEMEAWHEGKKLAVVLGIEINESLYDLYTEKAVDGYLYWSVFERNPEAV